VRKSGGSPGTGATQDSGRLGGHRQLADPPGRDARRREQCPAERRIRQGLGAGRKDRVVAATETLRGLSAPRDAAEAALWQLRAAPVLGRLYAHVQSELDRLKAEQESLTSSDLERLAARALGHEEVRSY
jgi:hypothetical protein